MFNAIHTSMIHPQHILKSYDPNLITYSHAPCASLSMNQNETHGN
jgi:hypothetical protein